MTTPVTKTIDQWDELSVEELAEITLAEFGSVKKSIDAFNRCIDGVRRIPYIPPTNVNEFSQGLHYIFYTHHISATVGKFEACVKYLQSKK
jgi:hypothetical protein